MRNHLAFCLRSSYLAELGFSTLIFVFIRMKDEGKSPVCLFDLRRWCILWRNMALLNYNCTGWDIGDSNSSNTTTWYPDSVWTKSSEQNVPVLSFHYVWWCLLHTLLNFLLYKTHCTATLICIHMSHWYTVLIIHYFVNYTNTFLLAICLLGLYFDPDIM